jgi:DNA-binding XRE family transcriptional regulator
MQELNTSMLLVSLLWLARLVFAIVAKTEKNRKAILRHRKIIGDAIRQHRKKSDLTQEKLAELVDLNPKYLGEVERGEKIISIEALLRVAKTIRVPIKVFFRDV